MNRSRITRFKRILSIEKHKLDTSITELKRISQTLKQRHDTQATLQSRFNSSITESKDVNSLHRLVQTSSWAVTSQSRIADIRNDIAKMESKRSELLTHVNQQRATVKGWERLIGKLEDEQADAYEKATFTEADDRFLSEPKIKNRRAR